MRSNQWRLWRGKRRAWRQLDLPPRCQLPSRLLRPLLPWLLSHPLSAAATDCSNMCAIRELQRHFTAGGALHKCSLSAGTVSINCSPSGAFLVLSGDVGCDASQAARLRLEVPPPKAPARRRTPPLSWSTKINEQSAPSHKVATISIQPPMDFRALLAAGCIKPLRPDQPPHWRMRANERPVLPHTHTYPGASVLGSVLAIMRVSPPPLLPPSVVP